MKPGNEQAPIRDEWLVNCTREFFIPLVNIIRPRIVIVLGKHPSEAILDAYGVEYPRNVKLSKLMERSPYRLTDSTVLFPVYHCGAGGTNRNRPMPVQEQDWQRIRKYTEGHDTGLER
jgi:uracil-DNA glycosylase